MSASVVIAEGAPRRCYELSLTRAGDDTRFAHCQQTFGPPAEAGAEKFERRLAIEDVVGDAAQPATLEGESIQSAASNALRGDRQFIIEIVRFGAGGAGAYGHYDESFMIPVLGRYGYRSELEFSARSTRGLRFRADRVKIGSFDVADGWQRLWRRPDPDWAAFMRYLYRHVAPDSIWLSARGRS
jgi:hypothetical protein